MRRPLYGVGPARRRSRRRGLAILLGLGALGLVFMGLARAEEESREVWHFVKGAAERTVDVTELPVFVRDEVVKRLTAEGYRRVTDAEPARDLEADVRTLVRHHGRFPEARPDPTRVERPLQLLGASLRLRTGVEGAPVAQVVAVPPGCAAGVLGLRPGDVVLTVGGRPPARADLGAWETLPSRKGQLRLRLLRTKGRIETWDIAWTPGPGAVGTR